MLPIIRTMIFVAVTSILLLPCLTLQIVIVSDPSNTFGLENQKVVLTCRFINADKRENVSVNWHHNGSPIKSIGLHYHYTSEFSPDDVVSHSLHFHLLRYTEGRYFCNVSCSNIWIASKEAAVQIAFLKEDFFLEPQDKSVNLGETVLLECIPPSGLPEPMVHWIKDNVTVSPDDRIHISESGNLRIDRVSWEDRGVYNCLAESFAFRRRSLGAVLSVRHRPYFVESPMSQSVPVQSSFELSCRAAGEPPPIILWRREPPLSGIPVERTRLLPTGALQFVQVRLQDAGYYVCRAVSPAGVIESIARINVVSPPGLIRTPPAFVSVLEGERIVLSCTAVGSPSPDVRWIRFNPLVYYLVESTQSGRIYVDSNGSLVIYSIRHEDSSHYECRASSSAGVTRSLTYIEVRDNPLFEPARFGALSSRRISVRLSESAVSVRILCEFPVLQSQPHFLNRIYTQHFSVSRNNLSVYWLVEGESLSSKFGNINRVTVEQNGSLLIRTLQKHDEGNYTCYIFNHASGRYSTWTTELLVTHFPSSLPTPAFAVNQVPEPPIGLTITNVGNTWITVQWDDVDDGAHFLGYKVFYLPATPEITFSSTVHRNFLSFFALTRQEVLNPLPLLDIWSSTPSILRRRQSRLVGLSPGVGYWIEVRKVNLFGYSPGLLFPRIVYTLNRTSHRFIGGIVLDSTKPDSLRPDYSPSIVGAGTISAFKNLAYGLQSVSFSELNVKSLTPNELLFSWVTRSTADVLNQIDGFRLNIKPVPITRCLAAAPYSPANQLSSLPFTNVKDSSVVSTTNLKEGSFVFSDHCSLSTDELLEQILRMSGEFATRDIEDGIVSPLSVTGDSIEQTFFLKRTVSAANPLVKTVGSGLMPFTCYEVAVDAFMDDSSYGRIWSPPSRPELALTLDSSPTYAPRLVAADWLLAAPGGSFNHSLSAVHRVRLRWKPLGLRMAHGALIGYMIHLLTNESDRSRSLKVPPDVHNKDVFDVSPHLEYLIYLSGITCRGEGVRGPGYRLSPAAYFLQEFNKKNPPLAVNKLGSSALPPWVSGVVVIVVLFWVVLGLLLTALNRCGGSNNQTQEKSTKYCGSRWYWCFFSHPVRTHWTRFARRLPSDFPTRRLNNEHLHRPSFGATLKDQRAVSSPSECDRTLPPYFSFESANNSGSLEECNQYPALACDPSVNSVAREVFSSKQLPLNEDYLKRSDDVMQCDTEVYANSDCSPLSDRILTTATIDQSSCDRCTVSNLTGSVQTYTTKSGLPDSISIPFPVPPLLTSGMFSDPSTSASVIDPVAHNLSGFCYLKGVTGTVSQLCLPVSVDEEIVPPYASCTVSPITRPDYSTSTQHAQSVVQRLLLMHFNQNYPVSYSGFTNMSNSAINQSPSTAFDQNSGNSIWFPHQDVFSNSLQAAQCNIGTSPLSTNYSPLLTISESFYPIPPPPAYPPPPPPPTVGHEPEFLNDGASSGNLVSPLQPAVDYLSNGSASAFGVSRQCAASGNSCSQTPNVSDTVEYRAPHNSLSTSRAPSKVTSLLKHLCSHPGNVRVSSSAHTSIPMTDVQLKDVTPSVHVGSFGSNSSVTVASEHTRSNVESPNLAQPLRTSSDFPVCTGSQLPMGLTPPCLGVIPPVGFATNPYPLCLTEFTTSTNQTTGWRSTQEAFQSNDDQIDYVKVPKKRSLSRLIHLTSPTRFTSRSHVHQLSSSNQMNCSNTNSTLR